MKVDCSIVVEDGGKYVNTVWVNDGEEGQRHRIFKNMLKDGEIEAEWIDHGSPDENAGRDDHVVTVEALRAWFDRCAAGEMPVRQEAIDLLEEVNETVRLTLRGSF